VGKESRRRPASVILDDCVRGRMLPSPSTDEGCRAELRDDRLIASIYHRMD